MSDQPPTLPPPLPGRVRVPLASRWMSWVLASTLMPAAPFIVLTKKAVEQAGGDMVFMVLVALACQLAASIWLARGFGRNRGMSTGGTVAMGIVFFLSSVAIGSAVFFAACLGTVSLDFK